VTVIAAQWKRRRCNLGAGEEHINNTEIFAAITDQLAI
jgi:hypothetical protein